MSVFNTVTFAGKEPSITGEKSTKKYKGMKSDLPIATIILIIVIVVVALLLASYVMNFWRSSKGTLDKGQNRVNEMGQTLDEEEFTSINGQTISGNEVASSIRNWANKNLCVHVVTKTQTSGTYYNFKTYSDTTGLDAANKRTSTENEVLITDAQNSLKPNYINPNGQFLAEIKRDANSTIVAVVFTQQ